MTYNNILITYHDCIAIITLNRAELAHALNQRMAEELADAVQALHSKARVIIITGAGKNFCAGADLKERQGMSESLWHAQHAALEVSVMAMLACPIPIIAAINGAAFGGGLEIAMACDFIYAASTATMGLTEARLGIMCGMGGTQLLPRHIGIARAKEMLFTGEKISAEQALTLGLVNRIIAPETLLKETMGTAQAIAENAPLSIAAIKRAVNEGSSQPLAQAMETELRYYNALLGSSDRVEGINAFNEKRKAVFTGN